MQQQISEQSYFRGRIGVATRDISPPAGIFFRNWGAATHDMSSGNHRPLEVSVMAISPGSSPGIAPGSSSGDDGFAKASGGSFRGNFRGGLLLVAIDLGWFTTPQTIDLLRRPLLEAYDLPEASVMVCLGHSHATPSMAVGDSDRPGGEFIPAYADYIVTQLIQATAQAMDNLAPATLTWRYGRCDLATNRDFPDPAGGRILTGYNPDAQADDTLLVGRATREDDGRVIATIVNYACHPTTLAWQNHLVSPDYIGAMRDVIQQETGGSPCLFLQGASGELAPAYQYVGDTNVADQHGKRLGHAVVSTLLGMSPPGMQLVYEKAVESGAVLAQWGYAPAQADETLQAIHQRVAVPMKPRPSLAEHDKAMAACEDRALKERMLRARRRLAYFDGHDTFDVPLTAWRVGPAMLFGHPLEAYSLYQTTLRQALPGAPVAAMNLANGSLGYAVPEALCDDGLYAWWQTFFDKPSLAKMIDASQACMKQLTS